MRVLRHILWLPRIPVAAYRIQVGLRAGAIGIEQPAMKLDAVLRRDDHRLLGLVEPIRRLDLFGRVESYLVRDFAVILPDLSIECFACASSAYENMRFASP